MAYQYDIFISYKRGLVGDQWLQETFIPLFQDAAENEIIAQCKRAADGLFFDQSKLSVTTRQMAQKGIEPGEDWRNALKGALETSRCLLAVCSPKYFLSEWCMIEWETFQKRNKELIIPITIHDGASFPSVGSGVQYADFNDYFIVGEGFVKTSAHVDFQVRIKELAVRVAKVVANAPNYGHWTVSNHGPVYTEPHIAAPKL